MKYISEKLEKRDGDIVYRHKQDGGSFVSYSSTPTLQKYDLEGFRLVSRIENWRGSGNTVFQKVQKFSFDSKGAKKSTQPAIVYRTRAKPSDPWTNLSDDSTFPSTDPVLTKEVYEDNFSTKKLSGICSSNKPCMKTEDLPEEYNGATNRSSSIILPSDVPKIFQGTESSFVVIESPFEPAPQQTQFANSCGNWTGCNRKGSGATRAPGDKFSFFQWGQSYLCYPWYYKASSCVNGSQIIKSGDSNYSGGCSNQLAYQGTQWYGSIPERTCTDSVVRCSFGGEWIADPHTTQADGFLFWSRYSGTSKANPGSGGNIQIQKSMLFRENQTKIDTSNMWTRDNTSSTGFKARMINWESNHNPLLKERWLLSPDGKLATYYTVQSPTVGDFADLEASTPTSLSI
jgi:hypothetical protein